jgi:hypothetical protein
MTGPRSFYTTAQFHARNLRWTGHIAWPLILSAAAAIALDGVTLGVLGAIAILARSAWACRKKNEMIRAQTATAHDVLLPLIRADVATIPGSI